MAMEEYFSSMHPAELVKHLILATIRSQSQVVLAVASTGIAATLSGGGLTGHSAFKLLLNLQNIEKLTCYITKTSAIAKVLHNCKIIIWDGCTMAHKRTLEALDRKLTDPFRMRDHSTGRRFSPVIPISTPADEVNACLVASVL